MLDLININDLVPEIVSGSLAEASENLEIEPCSATIIDITNIVKAHQEEQMPQ